MTGQWWGPLLGIVLSVIGSIVVAKLSAKAQDRKAIADADVTSGRLALDIAQRADQTARETEKRLNKLEGWRRAVVVTWWPTHERRDVIVEQHLAKLDPATLTDLPPRIPMPEINDD
jgi:hypothetical protein